MGFTEAGIDFRLFSGGRISLIWTRESVTEDEQTAEPVLFLVAEELEVF